MEETTSNCIALVSVAGVVAAWVLNFHRLKEHFLFLFFSTTVVLYLQVFPALSLIAKTLPGIEEFTVEYASIQIYCLLLFQLPLVCCYFACPGLRNTVHVEKTAFTLRVDSIKGRVVSWLLTVSALAFFVESVRYDLLFVRNHGEAVMLIYVDLPQLEFFLIRTYHCCGIFVIAICYFLRHYSVDSKLRLLATMALLTNCICYGTYAAANSRAACTLLCVTMLAWILHSNPRVLDHLRTIAISIVVGLYAILVDLNMRHSGFSFPECLVPHEFNPFGDNQGIDRLNGIDLMARMFSPISEHGPAWGAAWSEWTWLFWRFIDPLGFDDFRLTAATCAKNYLMWHYLGWTDHDYYACALTDVYGNFAFFGFPIFALLVALVFRFFARVFAQASSPSLFVCALFVLTHLLLFEQEGSDMLLGWIKKAPLLALLVIYNPFCLRPERHSDKATGKK